MLRLYPDSAVHRSQSRCSRAAPIRPRITQGRTLAASAVGQGCAGARCIPWRVDGHQCGSVKRWPARGSSQGLYRLSRRHSLVLRLVQFNPVHRSTRFGQCWRLWDVYPGFCREYVVNGNEKMVASHAYVTRRSTNMTLPYAAPRCGEPLMTAAGRSGRGD